MQKPSDCALLVTAPIKKKDFLSDLHNSDKDFVKNWAENQRLAADEDLTDDFLWEIYSKKVKDFILKTTAEIESLGVRVVFDAKLEDLKQIFSEKKVVALEAHWFSPKLTVEDFYNPNNFVKSLFESGETVSKALREAISSGGINSTSFSSGIAQQNFSDLVKNINKVFSTFNSKNYVPKPIFVQSNARKGNEEIWIQLNRFALELTFPDEVKRKCSIELFDGFCYVEEFIKQVPLNFDGVIDFTVCNSELVGKVVKQHRRNCLVITNRFTTDLKLRLILYKAVIKLLKGGNPQNYVDAAFSLRRQLLEMNRR